LAPQPVFIGDACCQQNLASSSDAVWQNLLVHEAWYQFWL